MSAADGGREGAYVHVVVENGVHVAVDVEQALRVADAKVFKVQERVRVVFPDELDESACRSAGRV